MKKEDLPDPLVIPRSEHPISRNNIDREALKVLYRLRDAGFAAYLVGGGVRDLMLGKTPKDFDISTEARPGQIRKIFRNSRIIGRRFRLVQVFFRGGKVIEVSTLRCSSEFDLEGKDEVLASNNTFGTLAEDAFRRDLTINSLFYEVDKREVVDYAGGVDDIKKGIIRIIGNPERRIIRDPVRIMRAIRHASRNGFRIEEKTWNAIISHRDDLLQCPVSRIRDELLKDFHAGAIKNWARLAIDSGIFFVLFPFYKNTLRENAKVEKQLFSILAVIERLQEQENKIPNHVIFALLLTPWAVSEMGLMSVKLKGAEFAAFSKRLRDALHKILLPLNIKRSEKAAVYSLLINLPSFIKFGKKGRYPSRIAKKSYFKECVKFSEMYREALGGPMVNEFNINNSVAVNKKSSGTRNKGRMPAFSKAKGGVFGFKR